IAGHGPLSDRAGLQEYHDFLVTVRDRVQALIDRGMTLQQAIAAKPTAEWDSILGETWITGDQLVTFAYNSLTGVDHFTRPESTTTTTE
ncbi:MAG: hypothetical protein OES53_06900, partial [Xanthomonadales bacterium]|nr:hypothetical protein [Xanthomonadales bacterium]